MSNATVEEPKVKPPKPLKPHAVILLNDDLHTFEYVVVVLNKVFGYPIEKGILIAKEVHEKGRAIVWTGTKELAELKAEQITNAGPDIFASVVVTMPLGAVVEQLP